MAGLSVPAAGFRTAWGLTRWMFLTGGAGGGGGQGLEAAGALFCDASLGTGVMFVGVFPSMPLDLAFKVPQSKQKMTFCCPFFFSRYFARLFLRNHYLAIS